MSNHNPPTNGFDKRKHQINRKGRPKSFDALRALALQIAHETAQYKGGDLIINGKKVTVAEAILRQWSQNNQKAFIEIAFGKVPDALDITSGNEKIFVHIKGIDD
jgi:hypothetical protein